MLALIVGFELYVAGKVGDLAPRSSGASKPDLPCNLLLTKAVDTDSLVCQRDCNPSGVRLEMRRSGATASQVVFMILKLKFIFIRRTRLHAAARVRALASAFAFIGVLILGAVCPAGCGAQSQPTALSTQTNQATPEANDPPNPASAAAADPEAVFPHFKSTRFWLSGQMNFIFQTHPPFPALYSGPHSLSPNYQKATSRVLTLYTGVRLNNSTEILADVEEAGGSALSQGFGLAGNTDLDIVRNPLLSKAPYLARGMIHKVFALSKDKIESDRSVFSLFDELPRRRLEVRFGKFSLPDFFDINSVGSDTHLQFTNWTVDNNGAWDYAADTRGYTVGATADYEDGNWGFRFAEALMPKVANGIDLVWKPWQAHAENLEYELRHGMIPHHPGVVRLLAYTNYANMGIYREQIMQAAERDAT